MKTRMKGSEVEGQVVTDVTFGSEVIELEGVVLRGGIAITLGDVAAMSITCWASWGKSKITTYIMPINVYTYEVRLKNTLVGMSK